MSGFIYNDNTYFYRKDVQGNIIGILDIDGCLVVEYVYDAWGSNTSTDISGLGLADLNPFRYHGYYYDMETGLYYLKTRYYDPEIGRFISIDGIEYLDPETINGLNLYAYCNNNPVMNVDPNGCYPRDLSEYIDYMTTIVESGLGMGLAMVSWAIRSGARPNNIGLGGYLQAQAQRLLKIKTTSNIVSKVSTGAAIAATVLAVVEGVLHDISLGYTVGRVISNATVNTVVYGAATLGAGAIGAWIGGIAGSFLPGLGNIVGALVGFGISLFIDWTLSWEYKGKSVINYLRDTIYGFFKKLFA